MRYPKKPGFNLYQLRHCAYITYSVKTWFLKILSVGERDITSCEFPLRQYRPGEGLPHAVPGTDCHVFN